MLYKIQYPCYFLIFFYRYIREVHQCPGSFQEAGSSFEKNEYAKRFFLVSTLKKYKNFV